MDNKPTKSQLGTQSLFGREVSNVECHVGVTLNPLSKQGDDRGFRPGTITVKGVNAAKHDAEMHLCPSGVLCRFAGSGRTYVIPFSNIEVLELEPA